MVTSVTFHDQNRDHRYSPSEISDAFSAARRAYLERVKQHHVIGDQACAQLTRTLNQLDDARDRLLAQAKLAGGQLTEADVRHTLGRTYTPRFTQ